VCIIRLGRINGVGCVCHVITLPSHKLRWFLNSLSFDIAYNKEHISVLCYTEFTLHLLVSVALKHYYWVFIIFPHLNCLFLDCINLLLRNNAYANKLVKYSHTHYLLSYPSD